MTGASIQEYSEAVRWWYLRGTKKDKGSILDELTKVTGYHRKAAIHNNRWNARAGSAEAKACDVDMASNWWLDSAERGGIQYELRLWRNQTTAKRESGGESWPLHRKKKS